MPPEECIFGKQAITQRRVGPRQFVLSGLPKVTAATSTVSLWAMLEFKTGNVPAFVDTRAQFSCVRSDVIEFLYMREKHFTFSSFSVSCFLKNGQRCEVTNVVKINIKTYLLSWDYEFKILRGCPFPLILRLDFLNHIKLLVHVDTRKFFLWNCPDCCEKFSFNRMDTGGEDIFKPCSRRFWGWRSSQKAVQPR